MKALTKKYEDVDDMVWGLVSAQKKRLQELFEIAKKVGINDFGWKEAIPAEIDNDTDRKCYDDSRVRFVCYDKSGYAQGYSGWRFKFDEKGGVVFTEYEKGGVIDESVDGEVAFSTEDGDNFRAANTIIQVIEKELECIVSKDTLVKYKVLCNKIKDKMKDLGMNEYVLFASDYSGDYEGDDFEDYVEDTVFNSNWYFSADENSTSGYYRYPRTMRIKNDELLFDYEYVYEENEVGTEIIESFENKTIEEIVLQNGEEQVISCLESILEYAFDEGTTELNKMRLEKLAGGEDD